MTRIGVLAVVLAVVLALLALNSACTILWLANSDPEGLPCDFSTDVNGDGEVDQDDGRCLQDFNGVDYTCVEGVCVKARALSAGEPCSSTDQCDEDLVCATEYAQCGDEASDEINCNFVGEDAERLACRPACDIANPNQCPADNRCFEVSGIPGINGFCQEGTCATDSDCQVLAGSAGLCVNEIGGRTGLCFESCDPFSCDNAAGLCASCNGLDGAPDEFFSCFPPPDEFLIGVNANRLVCLPHGGLAPFSPCGDPGSDICGFNTFCANTGNNVYCAPFCRFPNGAPACDQGTCTQISAGNDLGFCAL